eukprot:GFUD01002057.1.p1 GENE.GFUD01002057.1~~GFUD01002057.1.p1  ORF type:complete len:108 (-),score=14.47 GFUD01002057.1:686-1009(-)
MGSSIGPNLATGWPFLSTTNLVKFHLMALMRNPDCFSFRKAQRGSAPAPLTSTLANKSHLTPYLFVANSLISFSVPGSCPPNWLQGKPRMRKPSASEYLLYNSTSCL